MKRTFDLFISVFLVTLLLPVMIIISILVRLKLGSPIIFKQQRTGLLGKEFTIYKFRSMTNETDLNGNLLLDDKRITSFGRFLRRYSFDELPQLINVIKGDLSLVGPRPLLVKYLPRYTEEQFQRHNVKPGITGWAQINGRNSICWEKKFALDLWYVKHQSFWLDLKILFITFIKVFRSYEINKHGDITMLEFRGYLSNDKCDKHDVKKIIIIGAGGQGRETAQLIEDINKENNQWELMGFIDDNQALSGKVINGYSVIGTLDAIKSKNFHNIYIVCAIGNSKVRKKIIEKLDKERHEVLYATLKHPSCQIGHETIIGKGVIICANTVITTNVKIGDNVLINYSSTIGHDTVIEENATILPGCNISGQVILRKECEVGTGAAVIPGVEIGQGTIVGAGAVVTKSLPGYCTAVGVPAKVIKNHLQNEFL